MSSSESDRAPPSPQPSFPASAALMAKNRRWGGVIPTRKSLRVVSCVHARGGMRGGNEAKMFATAFPSPGGFPFSLVRYVNASESE